MTTEATAPTPTVTDLALLGAALWSWVAAVNRLGHASPASTLDYATAIGEGADDESAAGLIMRDFVAWTSGREQMSPGCESRLRSYVERCGWEELALDAAASSAPEAVRMNRPTLAEIDAEVREAIAETAAKVAANPPRDSLPLVGASKGLDR